MRVLRLVLQHAVVLNTDRCLKDVSYLSALGCEIRRHVMRFHVTIRLVGCIK